MWNRCIWLRIGTNGGFSQHNDKPTGTIKVSGFLLINARHWVSWRRTLVHGISS